MAGWGLSGRELGWIHYWAVAACWYASVRASSNSSLKSRIVFPCPTRVLASCPIRSTKSGAFLSKTLRQNWIDAPSSFQMVTRPRLSTIRRGRSVNRFAPLPSYVSSVT